MTKKLHTIAAWDKTEGGKHYNLFIGEIDSAVDIRKLFEILSKVGVTLTYMAAGVMIVRIGRVDNARVNDKIADLDEETGKFFNDISDKMNRCHGRNSGWVAEVQVYAKPHEVFGR